MPFSPLPRYSGGEGVGVRGKRQAPRIGLGAVPLTPDPSPPEYRGRGENDETSEPFGPFILHRCTNKHSECAAEPEDAGSPTLPIHDYEMMSWVKSP